MRSFRSYGFSISGEHFLQDYISWSRRVERNVCMYTKRTMDESWSVSQQNLSISWSWNSRKNIINSMSNRERRRMIHRETWICIRVYRNIHLIVMDQLSKGDLLFMDKKRNVILSHYFHPIFSFLDLELHK